MTSPTEVQTLEFENARALQSLFANDPRLLRHLEADTGAHITARDGWLKVEGTADAVSHVRRIFEDLDSARQQGIEIGRHDFRYAMQSSRENSGGLGELSGTRISTGGGRPQVIPRTHVQRDYVSAIREKDIVFGIGPAGTGKTYLAMAMAVEALKKQTVRRIILTRPAVEAGEALGFLPGDLNEKIFPYLRPLYDALHDMLDVDEIQNYIEKGVVEIAPLAYMRGRTLNHAFIILDEAQNTTAEQMFMFLTRLGAESRCVITGDRTQIDLPSSRKSGLIEAADALQHIPDIGFVQFSDKDVIRHALVQSIIQAYKHHRQDSRPA